jgi:hypothetical protein
METRVKYETANRYDEYIQLYITECIEAMYIKYRKEVDNKYRAASSTSLFSILLLFSPSIFV